MKTKLYSGKFLVSKEVIEDWETFNKIVMAELRQELENLAAEILQEQEDELINGKGDEQPVGFIKHDPA